MPIILESDVIDAYINNEINEYDVINLYMEGYISDNTMDLLIDEDDYISEAVFEVYNEMEALEEGMISRGINNIRAALTSDKNKKADLYHKNHLDALKQGKEKTAKKYLDKYNKLKGVSAEKKVKQESESSKNNQDSGGGKKHKDHTMDDLVHASNLGKALGEKVGKEIGGKMLKSINKGNEELNKSASELNDSLQKLRDFRAAHSR